MVVTAENPSLFRREVLEHRANRLYGDISIAVPTSWHAVGFTILAALAVALVFLASAGYSRVETVDGAIVLDRGVAAITPTKPGRIDALMVREGQQVRAGDPLARIRSDEDLAAGDTASQRTMAALAQQDERLAGQSQLTIDAAAQEQGRIAAQLDGDRREIASLDAQIKAQRRLLAIATGEFEQMRSVAAKGFISRHELNDRESTLILRRQQLAQLEQARVGKVAESAELRRSIAQADTAARSQAAGVQSSRAALAERRVEVESARGYVLTAPVDGIVTAVTARLGQPAETQQPLMVVIPAGARARAELYVPTSAAGFIAPGQEVHLAIDAFPYQTFGTIPARIVQISSVAVPRTGANGAAVPVYLATAELATPGVRAFGRVQPLLPSMALSGRIVTQRQSLLQWLFEPLFAIARR
jgi:membrane fusion protein